MAVVRAGRRGRESLWIASEPQPPSPRWTGRFAAYDAIALSVPTAQAMIGTLDGGKPDVAVWGAVAPNLGWSNLAREVMLDAKLDPSIPAFTTVMACATSLMAAIDRQGYDGRGGRRLALPVASESMSRVQIGLTQTLSDWLRHFFDARTVGLACGGLLVRPASRGELYIPSITNRSTRRAWATLPRRWPRPGISRVDQGPACAWRATSAVAPWKAGFFADLVISVRGPRSTPFRAPRHLLEETTKLKPVFDRTSGQGTLTAGNSSPLTGRVGRDLGGRRRGSLSTCRIASTRADRRLGDRRDPTCGTRAC